MIKCKKKRKELANMVEKKLTTNCILCIHYFVTWDKNFPKGCKLFGFKGITFPSVTVNQATGDVCKNFVKKK